MGLGISVASSIGKSGFSLQQDQFGGAGGLAESIYSVNSANWYSSRPYGFTNINSTMYLPISPENIKVTTNYATNIITTLYGVIEEHSEVRYYDIVISGTTGFAPRHIRANNSTSEGDNFTGRSAFEPSFDINLGGFFQQQVGVISSIANQVNDIAEVFTKTPNPTGIDAINSGYVAFHNLYRFLLQYKRLASGVDVNNGNGQLQSLSNKDSDHPLQFLNHKDGIKYDVVPINFTLTRSADNPMLYNYNIVLRGFNLRNVNASAPSIDPLAALGLGEVDKPINSSSAFSKFSDVSNGVGNLVSGLF